MSKIPVTWNGEVVGQAEQEEDSLWRVWLDADFEGKMGLGLSQVLNLSVYAPTEEDDEEISDVRHGNP